MDESTTKKTGSLPIAVLASIGGIALNLALSGLVAHFSATRDIAVLSTSVGAMGAKMADYIARADHEREANSERSQATQATQIKIVELIQTCKDDRNRLEQKCYDLESRTKDLERFMWSHKQP